MFDDIKVAEKEMSKRKADSSYTYFGALWRTGSTGTINHLAASASWRRFSNASMTFFSAKTRPPLAHEGTGLVGFGAGTGAGAGADGGAAWGLGGLRTSLVTAEGGAGSANDTLRESSVVGVAAETTRGDGATEPYERAR